MSSREAWLRRGVLALIPLPLLYASMLLAEMIPPQASGLQAVWIGNAAVLGLMLSQRGAPDRAWAVAMGGFAAGLALHLARGSAFASSALFACANTVECVVAFALIRRMDVRQSFDRARDVGAFVIACAAGTACSATIGAMAVMRTFDVPYVGAWQNWFRAALLAQLLLTPIIMLAGLKLRGESGAAGRWHKGEAVALLGGTAAAGAVCFYGPWPFLFLVNPPMLIVSIRLRTAGAVAATTIVAIIAVTAHMTGHGPIVSRLADTADQMLVLQLFLATIFLTSLPVAALLAERDAQAAAARLLAERFRAVVEAVGEVIFRTDMRGRWTYLNPAWETITGYRIADSLGESSLHYVDGGDRGELLERVEPVFLGEARQTHRVLRFHTHTGVRWMEVFVQPLRDQIGTIVGATGTLRDIDDRKRLEEHVTEAKRLAEERAREATTLADTDELTGLASRRAFLRQLESEIAAAAVVDRPLAVALFDVDHFKRINDRHGHGVGDEVLRQLAVRANGVVRSGDVVGRLGGEEFGVLMPGATALDAAVVAERLREAMERPRVDASGLPSFTVSVGIAMRETRVDGVELLANADVALYRAKNNGRNQVRLAA